MPCKRRPGGGEGDYLNVGVILKWVNGYTFRTSHTYLVLVCSFDTINARRSPPLTTWPLRPSTPALCEAKWAAHQRRIDNGLVRQSCLASHMCTSRRMLAVQ